MSVRKRKWTTKKGVREAWIVDYVDQHGDRSAKQFVRKKDADAYHATVRVDVHKGTHISPSKSPTVAEAADNWIKRVKADGREKTTWVQYDQHVKRHIVPRLGATTKTAQLTVRAVESFRDDLLATLTPAMARKVLTSLKSLLKAAGHTHAAGVTIKRNKRKEKRLEKGRDIPEPAEVRRIIEAAPDLRRRALVMVAALHGLRASELRGLRWADVDIPNAVLHVHQRADRYGEIGHPKTESSGRRIPIEPQTLRTLKEWKLACPVSSDPERTGELVFPTSTGAIEHHANMLRSLAPVMIAAHVVDKAGRPKYALHAFRHFFASWCLNPVNAGGRGMQAFQVQRLLGHSSIVMTNDVYGHLFPEGSDRSELAAASRALFA